MNNLIVDVSVGIEKKIYEIENLLQKYNFCVLRGAVNQDSIIEGIKKVKTYISENTDAAVTGEDASVVKDYFMKLSLGEGRHSGKSVNINEEIVRPRLKRVLYCPLNKTDKFGLNSSFKDLAIVRNFLMGIGSNFGLDDDPNAELWTASRIHHFPKGGGFMSSHSDTVLPKVISDSAVGRGFFQPIMVMSQKGLDYETGGGFAVIDGKTTVYEDFTEVGDIAVYNSATEHGCLEIDTHKPFAQRSGHGRFSGLVTLYKNLDQKRKPTRN
jgi:hypothetical protein